MEGRMSQKESSVFMVRGTPLLFTDKEWSSLKSQLDSRIEQLKEIKSILNGSHKDLLR
jgi:hypothetical protein